MTDPTNTPALEDLEKAVQNEKSELGLLEVAFYPGTDLEVSHDEAAKGVLELYNRFKKQQFVDITDRPL
jgi:hypothetical protein